MGDRSVWNVLHTVKLLWMGWVIFTFTVFGLGLSLVSILRIVWIQVAVTSVSLTLFYRWISLLLWTTIGLFFINTHINSTFLQISGFFFFKCWCLCPFCFDIFDSLGEKVSLHNDQSKTLSFAVFLAIRDESCQMLYDALSFCCCLFCFKSALMYPLVVNWAQNTN